MKKLSLTFCIVALNIAAFAQGKISFMNDSLHLYYLDPVPSNLRPADAALAGQLVPVNGILPSGSTLLIDLYGGTSANNLALITTTTFSSTSPGYQNPTGVTLAAIPGGAAAFFQVLIRDSVIPGGLPPWNFGSFYFSFSEIFTVVPSSSINYNSIVNHGGTAQSTWADGTYDLGPAGFGAVMFPTYIPEPCALSLISLGVAACLAARKRK